MNGKVTCHARVECQDCGFAENVEEGVDRLPGEIVIQHGREMGHKLRVEYPNR